MMTLSFGMTSSKKRSNSFSREVLLNRGYYGRHDLH